VTSPNRGGRFATKVEPIPSLRGIGRDSTTGEPIPSLRGIGRDSTTGEPIPSLRGREAEPVLALQQRRRAYAGFAASGESLKQASLSNRRDSTIVRKGRTAIAIPTAQSGEFYPIVCLTGLYRRYLCATAVFKRCEATPVRTPEWRSFATGEGDSFLFAAIRHKVGYRSTRSGFMSPVVVLRIFLKPDGTANPVSHTRLMATGLNSN
jgi:hypothetical protein